MNQPIRSNWARPLTDEREFKDEQARLGHCWTLLGIANDVAKEGDWRCATLGGRSVFFQRFGDAIRGFENRCAHRFFPLRTEEQGNGPVICGFHHWRYNQDGQAIGIPMCPEMFGVTPRELNARLPPVEIAICGSLVFGRFPRPDGTGESLEDFLGDAFPILETIATIATPPHRHKDFIEANWKLSVQITLDDYHTPAVHGRPAYQKNENIRYYRFGLHSAHFVGETETLASMAEQCRIDAYRPSEYRIFNIFPNLAISLFDARPYWYCHVQQFVPVAAGRSDHRGWFFPTQLPAPGERAIDRIFRPLAEPVRARIVRHHMQKIIDEDRVACERLQTVAHQIDSAPLLGWQEKRVGWFEESYAQAMS